ncbi:MAG: hypothetical protein AAF492_24720, partial [Verrucomicrobiota bacterium]
NNGNYNYWINDDGPQPGSGVGIFFGRQSGQNGRALAAHYRDLASGDGLDGILYGNFTGSRLSLGEVGLFVGRIDWGAAEDVITLYTTDLNRNLGPAISVLTTSVDQVTFDTLTFARGDRPVLDEVRFGPTFADVGGLVDTNMIYEPFGYPAGGLDNQSGGGETGLFGTWDANGTTLVDGSSLTYGNLLTSGGRLANFSGGQNHFGGARMATIGALAEAGLLDDDAVLWFSLIVGYAINANHTNARLGFALGNNAFNGGNFNYWINDDGSQLGSGLGLTLGRISGVNGRTVATHFRDQASGDGTSGNVLGDFNGTRYVLGEHGLIVGRITWGAVTDTIELFQPGTNLVIGPVMSTLSVSVDQSAFDTISFARGDRIVLDEIRFGRSYAEVTPPIVGPSDLLAVTKTVSDTTLHTGTNLTYTITVTNVSAEAAGGVVVTDSLPHLVSF